MSNTELHQEWEQRLAEFRASGQTAAQWCAAREIKIHRFWYWSRKLRPHHQQQPNGSLGWIAVKMDESPVLEEGTLTIRIGSASIEVNQGFNSALLKQVVQALSDAQ